MSILDTTENDALISLHKLCKKFIYDNRISCAEATVKDSVYENSPELVEEICKLIGYWENTDE